MQNIGFKENAIIKIPAATREKEIEIIAKEIKDLILNQKVEPHKICIAFNLINKYSSGYSKYIFQLMEFPLISPIEFH